MDARTNNPNSVSLSVLAAEVIAEEEAPKKQQKLLKKSQYKSFARLNLKNTEYLISLNRQNPTALNILLFLIQHSNNYNKIIISQQALMEYFGLSRSTISRGIADLKKHGFIFAVRAGTANVYIINDDLICKSWSSNDRLCEFPANIVLSVTKQEDYQKIYKDKTKKSKDASFTLTDEAIEEHDYFDPS